MIRSPQPPLFQPDIAVARAKAAKGTATSEEQFVEAQVTSEETRLDAYYEGVGTVQCTIQRNDTIPGSIPFFFHRGADTMGKYARETDVRLAAEFGEQWPCHEFTYSGDQDVTFHSAVVSADAAAQSRITDPVHRSADSLEHYYIDNWPKPLAQEQAAKMLW